MDTPKNFASLSPTLLARKGGAKPAMRPQLGPITSSDSLARILDEDLGWNDMGHEGVAAHETAQVEIPGEVVAFQRPEPVHNEVHRQQVRVAKAMKAAPKRRSALAEGRKAAFTLRLDAERHLRLRLASTTTHLSAQHLLLDALDRMLADMPEIETLAGHVAGARAK